MVFHKTLINIRKKHGYTYEEFAAVLGCTTEHIIALESNRETASFSFVTNLKNKLNLHSAPITQDERNSLMDGLQNWKRAIDYADMSKAKEQKPELEKGARASYSPSVTNFYDLHAADYYRAVGDMKAYEETMAALSKRTDQFSARHQYYYHCLLGAKAFVEKRYQDAIKAYKKAEELDKYKELRDVRFYYGMGISLSDRGYATRAIAYLEKADYLSKWSKAYGGRPNRRFSVYIDGYMASDLAKLGKIDEALEILDRRLVSETKRDSKEGIGYTYFSFGRVYYRTENYDKAIENFDSALKNLDKGTEAYMSCLSYKTASLIASSELAGAKKCAEKGLRVTTDEYWKTLFDALKHSASLQDDPKSYIYLKETLIPKLQEYGKNEAVVHYYQQLSKFYFEFGSSEVAFKYSNLALEIHKKLHKELVEGDV